MITSSCPALTRCSSQQGRLCAQSWQSTQQSGCSRIVILAHYVIEAHCPPNKSLPVVVYYRPRTITGDPAIMRDSIVLMDHISDHTPHVKPWIQSIKSQLRVCGCSLVDLIQLPSIFACTQPLEGSSYRTFYQPVSHSFKRNRREIITFIPRS